jgi:SNF2 family DNA or RNA helicase
MLSLPELRVARAADGGLLLSQVRYSSTLQAELLKLPRRVWNGTAWNVPAADVALINKLPAKLVLADAGATALLAQVRRKVAMTRAPRVLPELMAKDAPITDYEFKRAPFLHQKFAFLRGRKQRQFAFLMEMGTGKTATAINVFSYHLQRGALEAMIIVSPIAVLWNWEREIEEHSPLPPEKRKVAIIYGDSNAEKLEKLEAAIAVGCNVFITNYASFLDARIVAAFGRITVARKTGMLLDESTAIQNASAKTSKGIYKVAVATQARYILTGSPVANNPLSVFGQFKFLDWRILGHSSFTSFKQEFAIFLQKGPLRGRKIVEWKNLDRLQEKIADVSYRVLKADCLDLPEKVFQVLELPMGAKQRQAYESMRDECVASMEGATLAAPLIVTKLLRLAQISAGYFPILDANGNMESAKWFADEPKIPATKELVEEIVEEGKKVIIWCRGVPELERLSEELKSYGCVTYYGKTPALQRQKNVDAFQKDPNVRVFIGQAQTGGMAITLTAASEVIYYSNSFSLFDRLQSADRAHRIGQKSKVTYRDLLCRGSVDRLIHKALAAKKDLADVVTGDNIRRLLKEQ